MSRVRVLSLWGCIPDLRFPDLLDVLTLMRHGYQCIRCPVRTLSATIIQMRVASQFARARGIVPCGAQHRVSLHPTHVEMHAATVHLIQYAAGAGLGSRDPRLARRAVSRYSRAIQDFPTRHVSDKRRTSYGSTSRMHSLIHKPHKQAPYIRLKRKSGACLMHRLGISPARTSVIADGRP